MFAKRTEIGGALPVAAGRDCCPRRYPRPVSMRSRAGPAQPAFPIAPAVSIPFSSREEFRKMMAEEIDPTGRAAPRANVSNSVSEGEYS